MSAHCTVCAGTSLKRTLELGDQPPSNRFVPEQEKDVPQETYPLSLGYCVDCGTIQLIDRIPPSAIRPRFAWLTNNEPEGHLDDLVERLVGMGILGKPARVLGVSYKDQSLLNRLQHKGVADLHCLGEGDFPELTLPAGLESFQGLLSDQSAVAGLREKLGAFDLVVARHMLEHAESSGRFLEGVRRLLSAQGVILLELPDSKRVLENGFHPFVWEEHFSYFCEESLAQLATISACEILATFRYPGIYEDVLVALLRPIKVESSQGRAYVNASEPECLSFFSKAFPEVREAWHRRLASLTSAGEKLAVFGAGHLSVKLINFFDIAKYFDCVVDDHPKKAGMLMPGSLLPIVPTCELDARKIRVCISTLSPESEVKVRAKYESFFRGGGRFIPAFDFNREQVS